MSIARALIEGRPDRGQVARDAAALGIVVVGEIEDESVEVWPEHMTPLQVMVAMGTQMNVAGMGGIIGYRYEALPFVMDTLGVVPSDRADVFECFRIMEAEVVRLIRERSNRG